MQRCCEANDGEDSKRKATQDNRRNSLAAAIECYSERELLSREKELEFKRFKFEVELQQREHDRE